MQGDNLIPKSLGRLFSVDFGPLYVETRAAIGSEFNKGHGDAAEITGRSAAAAGVGRKNKSVRIRNSMGSSCE